MIGITHNQFLKLFSDIAIAHRDINSFYSGDLDNYTANQSETLNPVTLWVVIDDDVINGKTDKPKYNFIVLDWVNQDSSNLDEVYSDTLRISKDILALLRQPYYEDFFKVQEEATFTPFNEKFDSDVAGWQFSLTFDQPFIYDACEVNTTGLPTINYDTIAISSSTYTWGNITGTLSNQTDLQTALNAKVPTSRILTINGTSYNLSADRSWTISTGGETLAQTLILGNTSGANNLIMNDDQSVILGGLGVGYLKYNSLSQHVILGNSSGGQYITLTDTGGISLSTLSASRVVLTDSSNNITTSANITYDGTTFNNGATYVNIGNYASPTNLRKLTIGQDTAYCTIGSRIGTTSQVAFYGNQASPSSSNWFIITDGSALSLNATAGQLALQTNNTNRYTIASTTGIHTWTTGTAPGTATTFFNWTAGNSTTQTASTAIPKAKMTLGSTQWSTGALAATQKAFDFTQPVMSFVGASTATLAATIGITGAYDAGTNATITTSVGLLIQSAAVNSAGTVTTSYGAYINAQTGAATNHALGLSGNLIVSSGYIDGRFKPRVTSITSSATPTINTDNCDAVTITALAAAITSFTTNLTGTPNNFDELSIRIKDDGTARAITWGASFEAKGVALPTTTVISKVLTVKFIYDSVTSKWGCVASAQEV